MISSLSVIQITFYSVKKNRLNYYVADVNDTFSSFRKSSGKLSVPGISQALLFSMSGDKTTLLLSGLTVR